MSGIISVDEYKSLIRKRPPSASGKILKTSKSNKFNNVRLDTEDGKFDSKKEYERWRMLKLLAAKGAITELKRQVTFKLEFNKIVIEKYIADFTYVERGNFVVEDSKGYKTPAYRRKRKWMEAFHKIRIKET